MTTNRIAARGMGIASAVAHWPPLVYVALGSVLSVIWALGTSVQVLTSEAWMMHQDLDKISFNAFGQLWDACHGQLPAEMLVPFIFGWGVQFALIISSVGVELPPHPRWRYWAARIVTVGLVIVNSCGDFYSSTKYGTWGQWGFTLVIFFITFCMLLFAIMAFMHAWKVKSQM